MIVWLNEIFLIMILICILIATESKPKTIKDIEKWTHEKDQMCDTKNKQLWLILTVEKVIFTCNQPLTTSNLNSRACQHISSASLFSWFFIDHERARMQHKYVHCLMHTRMYARLYAIVLNPIAWNYIISLVHNAHFHCKQNSVFFVVIVTHFSAAKTIELQSVKS